jgi:4a-hydroxytetrahydrobiopterin dehydratase
MLPPPSSLLEKKCFPRTVSLTAKEVTKNLDELTGWQLEARQPDRCERIVKQFDFKDYYETLSFINAIAYVIHAEDHHPVLLVTYDKCMVAFNTHSVDAGKGGLSENDFICAAKVDAIFQQSFS